MSGKVIRLTTSPDDSGTRLDLFLSSRVKELSRTRVRKIIDIGGVHVAGRRNRRCSYLLSPGETVEIHLDGLSLAPFVLDETRIIYRDKYLLAIDKPSGIDTQPTPARYKGTVYAALIEYLRDPFRPLDKPSLGMVQRLDRETSGIMVFSIHPRAHRALTAAFSGRNVAKSYLALVQGHPEESRGEIRSFLARNRASNRMKSVQRGGKEAITRYRVLEQFDMTSLLEVEILTGRTHQIRVHLAEKGHPILKDDKYGFPSSSEKCSPRLMLHAHRLRFPHPVTGEILDLESPLPDDMVRILDDFAKDSENDPGRGDPRKSADFEDLTC